MIKLIIDKRDIDRLTAEVLHKWEFVAGVDYASFVQGKGFSTLAHAELILKKNLQKDLESIVIDPK